MPSVLDTKHKLRTTVRQIAGEEKYGRMPDRKQKMCVPESTGAGYSSSSTLFLCCCLVLFVFLFCAVCCVLSFVLCVLCVFSSFGLQYCGFYGPFWGGGCVGFVWFAVLCTWCEP